MHVVGHRIRLNTSWVNYNCGVRMVGRLRLEHSPTESTSFNPEVPYSLRPEVYAELDKGAYNPLIKEFIAGVQDKSLVPKLCGEDELHKNPVFENDQGKYVPTVILVADNLTATQGLCYIRWAALVRELESNFGEYGVEVIKGPLFNNAVYGDHPHISRVWSLVLPMYSNKLLKNKFPWTVETLTKSGYTKENLSNGDWKDIQEYLKAA